MSARRRVHRTRTPVQRGPSVVVVAALGAVVLAIAAAAWVLFRPSVAGEGTTATTGLPGPIGGSGVAMDVNTLVGKPAPAFTLLDSDGKSYAVTPGQGRPIVVISHMGIT